MDRLASELIGRRVAARDGEVGRVDDLFVDDERWAVRYLVVDTGDWLSSRRVLLSPASVVPDAPDVGPLPVALTRAGIEHSPDVDLHRPVSRQYEIAHALYYGSQAYWSGPMLWGSGTRPSLQQGLLRGPLPGLVRPPLGRPDAGAREEVLQMAQRAEQAAARSHLRSVREVIGYDVDADDGRVGVLDDLVIDARSWAVLQLVIDARPWWPGGHVRVSSSTPVDIDWSRRRMRLRCARDALHAVAQS
jgi:sporulation protein YlmC with PRC-barrel domain